MRRQEGFEEPVCRAGKSCLIAKESRIPADWARPPWLAHFALQAGHSCTAGDSAAFCGSGSGIRFRQVWVRRQEGFEKPVCRAGSMVRRAGKAGLIAKESRIPADWARPPWLAHFALQAGLTCTAGDSAAFCGSGSGIRCRQDWVRRQEGFEEPVCRAGSMVRRAGKAGLIAKESRIPADWARPPWLAHFALQAGHSCTAGKVRVCCNARAFLRLTFSFLSVLESLTALRYACSITSPASAAAGPPALSRLKLQTL